MKFCANEILAGGLARLNRVGLNLASDSVHEICARLYLMAKFTHTIRSRPQNFARRFAEYIAKILQNFLKLYMNSDKIAAATDKICSSLDKTVRDNRHNFVKFSQHADRACLLCYLIHAVFIARTKGGAVLGFDTRTEAIPPLILATPSLALP